MRYKGICGIGGEVGEWGVVGKYKERHIGMTQTKEKINPI